MSGVLNDCDALLQGAGVRILGPRSVADLKVGGRNLLRNSRSIVDLPNNTGLGTSTERSDEEVPYYRITATSSVSTYTLLYPLPGVPVGTLCTMSSEVRIGTAGTVARYAGAGATPVPANTWTRIAYQFVYDGVGIRLGHTYGGTVLDYRNYKVEIGNVATDWTPAPEDVAADAQAKADAAANWATATAATYAQAQAALARTNAEAYADGIVTAEEARAIADATARAESAKTAAVSAAAADATAKANAIKIGGRNLYKRTSPFAALVAGSSLVARLDTGFQLFHGAGTAGGMRLSNVIPSAGEFTISFDAYVGTADGFTIGVDICDSAVWTITLTRQKQHFEKTFSVTNWSADVYNFVDFAGLSWQYHYFENFKVEFGNKATTYTPAPEDVAADAQAKADAAANWAVSAAATYAAAQAELARTNAEAHADGIVTEAEARAIADASAKAEAARAAAVAAAAADATAKANAAAKTADVVSVIDYGGAERETNRPPSWYPTGTMREFKYAPGIGLPTQPETPWCTLETIKQYAQNGTGFPGYQYAYYYNKTYRRRSIDDAGTGWTAWVQDLDRNAYTGDLNASYGAPGSTPIGNGTPATTVEANANAGATAANRPALTMSNLADSYQTFGRTVSGGNLGSWALTVGNAVGAIAYAWSVQSPSSSCVPATRADGQGFSVMSKGTVGVGEWESSVTCTATDLGTGRSISQTAYVTWNAT